MPLILKEINKQIAWVTINRPEVLNAMNESVLTELVSTIQSCIDNTSVGVIILTGEGDKAFVAGADIKNMQSMEPEDALEFGRTGQQMTLTIENSPKPVIAAVNGFALGGGCEISLACHIRVASETATFGQPEVQLGILPGWGGTQRLPRLVGTGIANEIITTGRMVSASEAKEIGLVNHVVPAELLNEKCEKIANQILKEINQRLSFLNNVGLGYLSLSRSAATLSGGESQRIRLATQIGSQLMGVLYILDEPSIGLHSRDNARLLSTLKTLRDIGNSILVVEHDQETMESSDFIIDIGPKAGKLGGEVVFAGPPEEIYKSKKSLTAFII